MSDLRFRVRISRFETYVNYAKSSFFAHTLRRDSTSLARKSLLGRFFPAGQQPDPVVYFSNSHSRPDAPKEHQNVDGVIDNVVNWLTGSCQIPFEAIRWLCVNQAGQKEKFHNITREAYLREIHADWAADYQCDRLGCRGFYPNYCFADYQCDPSTWSKTSLNPSVCCNNHFRKYHTDDKHLVSDLAESEYSRFKKEEKLIQEEIINTSIVKNVAHFRKTQKRGPKPPGHRKHQNKFHCNQCNINFATSLASMIAHRKTHARHDITKIGIVKRGNYKGSFRPHEHQYNKNTNTWGFGPGATLHEIRYPQGCFADGQLICRNCKWDQYQPIKMPCHYVPKPFVFPSLIDTSEKNASQIINSTRDILISRIVISDNSNPRKP